MLFFQLLQTLDDQIIPQRCKIHLAGWNGEEDPLNVYFEGRFDEWQTWQTKKNFERDIVVSLIALPKVNHWLFAGVHNSMGADLEEEKGLYRYRLERRKGPNELDGRLIVLFQRPGRQSYLLGEKWSQDLQVAEIRPDKLQIAEFPGYSWALLSKKHLDIIIKQEIESWRSALRNVSGIYVIADRQTGKLYVGSATAGEGIWSRWCDYSITGHGGNQELIELLRSEGDAYAENFQFGILEIADTHASKEDIRQRETHWKELLLTRYHGYNAN